MHPQPTTQFPKPQPRRQEKYQRAIEPKIATTKTKEKVSEDQLAWREVLS